MLCCLTLMDQAPVLDGLCFDFLPLCQITPSGSGIACRSLPSRSVAAALCEDIARPTAAWTAVGKLTASFSGGAIRNNLVVILDAIGVARHFGVTSNRTASDRQSGQLRRVAQPPSESARDSDKAVRQAWQAALVAQESAPPDVDALRRLARVLEIAEPDFMGAAVRHLVAISEV